MYPGKYIFIKANFIFLIEHLKHLSRKYHVTTRQLGLGQRISRAVKVKYLLNSGRILKSTQQLDLGHITLKDFLLQCSHSAERYIREEMNWHINVEQGNPLVIKLKPTFIKKLIHVLNSGVMEENEYEVAIGVEGNIYIFFLSIPIY